MDVVGPDPPADPATLTPYVQHLLASVGWDRVMFGSNWPVATAVAGYRAWVELIDGLLAGATDEQRDAVFAANAERLYALS